MERSERVVAELEGRREGLLGLLAPRVVVAEEGSGLVADGDDGSDVSWVEDLDLGEAMYRHGLVSRLVGEEPRSSVHREWLVAALHALEGRIGELTHF